jgi:hypothetical protein
MLSCTIVPYSFPLHQHLLESSLLPHTQITQQPQGKSTQRSSLNFEEQRTFRFRDLPYEIRQKIYAFLPLDTSHYKFHSLDSGEKSPSQSIEAPYTLVVQSAPVSILATCRSVHDEALPVSTQLWSLYSILNSDIDTRTQR